MWTSLTKFLRSEGDEDAIMKLWIFSTFHFFPSILPDFVVLGLDLNIRVTKEGNVNCKRHDIHTVKLDSAYSKMYFHFPLCSQIK